LQDERLYGERHQSGAEEFHAGAAVHLALDGLQAIDLAFDGPVAPRFPDTTGTSTWTFVLAPNTAGTTFYTTLAINHPYLSVTTTLTTSILPAAPGGRTSAVGFYPSPRGVRAISAVIGTAQLDRIEATFNGSDCVLSAGPVVFTGSVSLTKAR